MRSRGGWRGGCRRWRGSRELVLSRRVFWLGLLGEHGTSRRDVRHQRASVEQLLTQRLQAVTTAGSLIKDPGVEILEREELLG